MSASSVGQMSVPPMPGRAGMEALLRPASVAVIGASVDPIRIGGRPIAYMKQGGYRGRILPVNPNRAEVQDLPCFASVADLPETPDLAIVAVPGEAAIAALDALGARGTKAAIVFTAGFAEVGPEGAASQERLVAAARRHGMRILGPNCLGLFNAPIGLYPIFSSSFEGGFPLPGRLGIASQSGAFGTHLFATARNRRIGTSVLVTTGNESDVTVADAIDWMAEADEVDVIMAYIEGVRDGRVLVEAFEKARRARKPIVMMKVGRSAIGSAAAQSHTASIAGDDAVFDAVLEEFGVVRARTTEELIDIAQLATQRIFPVDNTLGVITVSGGVGVLISDAAEAIGLPMPPMPEAAQRSLKQALPISSPVNPVDCTAQALNDISLVGRFTRSTVRDGGYASILAFFTQIGGAKSLAPAIRQQMNAVKAEHPDRLYVLSVIASDAQIREYEADGYLNFEDPARAVVAIAAMGRFGQAFAKAEAHVIAPIEIALPASDPSEGEAKRLLGHAGIAAAPERETATPDEAADAARRLGFPVVMKIVSPDILHKSEIGGVLLDLQDEAAVRNGFATLMERAARNAPRARLRGVLVARQLKGGVECILGIHHDPVFGPVAMFGLGGIFVEIMKDVVFRRCPFDETEARRMIGAIKGAPLLMGARGRPPADLDALAAMLSRLSRIAAGAGPGLVGIELNPVLAMPQGEGAYAVDAVIQVAPR